MQETIPHPNVHLTIAQNLAEASSARTVAEVTGVRSAKFSQTLEGWSRVFGVKFRPGGTCAFSGKPASSFTNRVLPADQIFGAGARELAEQFGTSETPEEMAARASIFLVSLEPRRVHDAETSGKLVDLIASEPEIVRVDQLAQRTGVSVRSLERLFHRYVGVSPKWVIRRFRLHELVERLNSEQTFDGATVASDLDYADQAHLIRDFKAVAGYTPLRYRTMSRTAMR